MHEALHRHRVVVSGHRDGPPIVFGHGYGADQSMWRFLTPAFGDTYRTVVFDYPGHGGAPVHDEPADRYTTLTAYAEELLEICRALDLTDAVFVGHSVSGIIGILAANAEPHRFAGLVLMGSSPRFVDDGDYIGGYTEADIADLLETLDSNVSGWARDAAPDLIGDPGRDDLIQDLVDSLARTDRRIARQFARATFLSDHRADLAKVTAPTLVLHCTADTLVPRSVGEYIARTIPTSRLEMIVATGHFPHLSAPDTTAAAIRRFLGSLRADG